MEDKRATKRRKTLFVDDEALSSSGEGSDSSQSGDGSDTSQSEDDSDLSQSEDGSDTSQSEDGSDTSQSEDDSDTSQSGDKSQRGDNSAVVDNKQCVKTECSNQAVYDQLCEECVDDARKRMNKKERKNYVNCSNVKCDEKMRARKLFYCASCNKRPLCFDCVVGNVSTAPEHYKCFRCLCPDVPGTVIDMWSDYA